MFSVGSENSPNILFNIPFLPFLFVCLFVCLFDCLFVSLIVLVRCVLHRNSDALLDYLNAAQMAQVAQAMITLQQMIAQGLWLHEDPLYRPVSILYSLLYVFCHGACIQVHMGGLCTAAYNAFEGMMVAVPLFLNGITFAAGFVSTFFFFFSLL